MKAYSVKSYDSGFNLNEIELSRLNDIAKEQLIKVSGNAEIHEFYEVSFKNGTMATYENIQEVLDLENYGNGLIIGLEIYFTNKLKQDEPLHGPEKEKESYIKMSFRNTFFDSFENYKTPYLRISGDNKDWVFITTSIFQERLDKIVIKNFYLNTISSNKIFRIGMLILLYSIFISPFWFVSTSEKEKPKNIDSKEEIIKVDYGNVNFGYLRHQRTKNYIEELRKINTKNQKFETVVLEIEKAKKNSEVISDSIFYGKRDSIRNLAKYQTSNIKDQVQVDEISEPIENIFFLMLEKLSFRIKFILGGLIFVMFFESVIYFGLKNYQIYNFLWGDYVNNYEIKRRKLNFFLYSIILAIILSIIANKLTNLF